MPPRTKDVSYFGLSSSNKYNTGMTHFRFSYYWKFIPHFSSVVSPITALIKKNTPFVWTVACQMALDTIKHVIMNSPVLMYPNPSKEHHLFMDALNHTWLGVLSQQRSNSEISGN